MAKQVWKGGNMLYPLPAVMVSCANEAGEKDIVTVAWAGTVCTNPPMLSISLRPERHSYHIIRESGEFVVNLVSWNLREQMNITSTQLPRGGDEFELAGLAKAACMKVRPPRVQASPANLECRVIRIVEIEPTLPGETRSTVVMGRVVGLHIQDEFIDAQGRFDTVKAQPTTRLGGYQYATVGEVVEMPAPFTRAA